ncbi:transcriptional regulatory pro-1 [Fusarium heterosporum]|uniref:Transcriptional regulatory pro-1 n=1 Tax=Fusarium heterosporum TaxID=42747 RepID=A0A8H5STE8_FUSHE|nr:transcriptional regulatory pro-1 [Fusarium heterosporum]
MPGFKPCTSGPRRKKKTYRRSRNGCYTCRRRRKKCDEATPTCADCKRMGLTCEYKKPMYWSHETNKGRTDSRKFVEHKIRSGKPFRIIQNSIASSSNPTRSFPTSATSTHPRSRTRLLAVRPQPRTAVDLPRSPSDRVFRRGAPAHPESMLNNNSPFEIDTKAHRRGYVNNVPTARQADDSASASHRAPLPADTLASNGPLDTERADRTLPKCKEALPERYLDCDLSNLSYRVPGEPVQFRINLDEIDQYLPGYFIQSVLPTIFPTFESNQDSSIDHGSSLQVSEPSSAYRHYCLSVAAQHLKSCFNISSDKIDNSIVRHRYATFRDLRKAIEKDENHQQILEVILALILFQSVVGRYDDGEQDISWHHHFDAAVSLMQKLEHLSIVTGLTGAPMKCPVTMSLFYWIDILGASTKGRPPVFAHKYREKYLSQLSSSLGLWELMGCDDRVMYLVSEIACLEALKKDGMDDFALCQHVYSLGEQIDLTEMREQNPRGVVNPSGEFSPEDLVNDITTAFRIVARIYVYSLVPGFDPRQPSCMALVEKLTAVLLRIPSGPDGYDRSLPWVYLVGGSNAFDRNTSKSICMSTRSDNKLNNSIPTRPDKEAATDIDDEIHSQPAYGGIEDLGPVRGTSFCQDATEEKVNNWLQGVPRTFDDGVTTSEPRGIDRTSP